MNIDNSIENRLINMINKLMNTQFKNKLITDYAISDIYAESIIKSAAIADLYIEIKGKQECRLLGIDNKDQLLEIILFLSKKHKWVAFEKIKNKRAFIRKIKGYKQQQDIYQGLTFLVSKKESNMVSKNAKKITDDQLAILKIIITENNQLSNSELYKIMKTKLEYIEVQQNTILHYIRKIKVEEFREKHILN